MAKKKPVQKSGSEREPAVLGGMTIADQLERRTGLMSAQEVCATLGCHPKTLYKWVKKGRIPVIRGVGTRLKFDPAVISAWLRQRQ